MVAFAVGGLAPLPARAHGDIHERMERASRAIEASPDRAEPYLERAELHRHRDDFAAALADLDRAARIDPQRTDLDFFRGRIQLDAGRAAEAEAALRRFLARDPRNPAAREARARALALLGRPLEAAREYDLAIESQPVPIPATYLARAEAFAAAGDAHLPEAVRGLDEGIAMLGPVTTLQRAAIELELRRGDFDAALVRLERAAASSPRQERWLARRGEILERAGQLDEARASFELALAELERLTSYRRRSDAMLRLEAQVRGALGRLPEKP